MSPAVLNCEEKHLWPKKEDRKRINKTSIDKKTEQMGMDSTKPLSIN